MDLGLPPAAKAFDSIADSFDRRFGEWLSVAAQRKAVRDELETTFPPLSSLLEIGGGTGEDALWMASRGFRVLMTDISPEMVRRAKAKFVRMIGLSSAIADASALDRMDSEEVFDGAYSNFAALNCVEDLHPFARGLAERIRPGGTHISTG